MSEIWMDTEGGNDERMSIGGIFDRLALYRGVRMLELYSCINLTSFPDSLPDTIERLLIAGCPISLLSASHYPKNLKRLYVRSCRLTDIASVPDGLDVLDLYDNKLMDMSKCIARRVKLTQNGITRINVTSGSVRSLSLGRNPLVDIKNMGGVETLVIDKIQTLDMSKLTARVLYLVGADRIVGKSKTIEVLDSAIALPNESPRTVHMSTATAVHAYESCEELHVSNIPIKTTIIGPKVRIFSIEYCNIHSTTFDLSDTNIINLYLDVEHTGPGRSPGRGPLAFPKMVEKLHLVAYIDHYDMHDLSKLKYLGLDAEKKGVLEIPDGLEYFDYRCPEVWTVELVPSLKVVHLHGNKISTKTRPKCLYLGV